MIGIATVNAYTWPHPQEKRNKKKKENKHWLFVFGWLVFTPDDGLDPFANNVGSVLERHGPPRCNFFFITTCFFFFETAKSNSTLFASPVDVTLWFFLNIVRNEVKLAIVRNKLPVSICGRSWTGDGGRGWSRNGRRIRWNNNRARDWRRRATP